MQLKTPQQYKDEHPRLTEDEKLDKSVNAFVDGPLREAIEATFLEEKIRNSASVNVPGEAYRFPNGHFSKKVIDLLGSKGYRCKEGHDGGGMYAVYYIQWD